VTWITSATPAAVRPITWKIFMWLPVCAGVNGCDEVILQTSLYQVNKYFCMGKRARTTGNKKARLSGPLRGYLLNPEAGGTESHFQPLQARWRIAPAPRS
jgi:hypothetical protein